MTYIIGDVHGKIQSYKDLILNNDITDSIQVGDMGVGFDDFQDIHLSNLHAGYRKLRFIRGNHDNPEKCKEITNYIEDGVIENDVMFVGGAYSIDQHLRTTGIDWWENEELSYSELQHIIDIYEDMKPTVMITHAAPRHIANHMFKLNPPSNSRTCQCFEMMLNIHLPKFWFFGHYHETKTLDFKDVRFHCLDELDYVNFDFYKKDYINE